MATVVETSKRTLEPEQRILIRNVGWEGDKALLAMVGDGHPRLAFDGKDAELMSPPNDHESDKNYLWIFILTVAGEFKTPCRGKASTTWRKKAKEVGIEPDLCYYTMSALRIRGKKSKIELANDPSRSNLHDAPSTDWKSMPPSASLNSGATTGNGF